LAGFQVIIYGRFWVITEGITSNPNKTVISAKRSTHKRGPPEPFSSSSVFDTFASSGEAQRVPRYWQLGA
jgi:hypothetical protein